MTRERRLDAKTLMGEESLPKEWSAPFGRRYQILQVESTAVRQSTRFPIQEEHWLTSPGANFRDIVPSSSSLKLTLLGLKFDKQTDGSSNTSGDSTRERELWNDENEIFKAGKKSYTYDDSSFSSESCPCMSGSFSIPKFGVWVEAEILWGSCFAALFFVGDFCTPIVCFFWFWTSWTLVSVIWEAVWVVSALIALLAAKALNSKCNQLLDPWHSTLWPTWSCRRMIQLLFFTRTHCYYIYLELFNIKKSFPRGCRQVAKAGVLPSLKK